VARASDRPSADIWTSRISRLSELRRRVHRISYSEVWPHSRVDLCFRAAASAAAGGDRSHCGARPDRHSSPARRFAGSSAAFRPSSGTVCADQGRSCRRHRCWSWTPASFARKNISHIQGMVELPSPRVTYKLGPLAYGGRARHPLYPELVNRCLCPLYVSHFPERANRFGSGNDF
jgi:hypothetical protein